MPSQDLNQLAKEFSSRMDADYFAAFTPEEVSEHIRMAAALDAKHRLRVLIKQSGDEQFDITIVGFDYLSEFVTFCGLLSAFGLHIRSGDIYSFSKGVSARKIVDRFRVHLKPGETFDEARRQEFERELLELAELLATGSTAEARERLNRFVTERVEQMNEPLAGLLHPLEIRFDNDASSEWTVMEAQSEDAFALLYSIANGLAMRGIYIHKVKIGSGAGSKAIDQFFIADRWGRKVDDTAEQQRLRTTVGMIKQFTRFLPEAPDPAKAMRHFDQFLDKIAEANFPDHVMAFLARPEGMNLLAQLLGSSDYLWHDFLGAHFGNLLPMLERMAAESETLSISVNKDALRADLQSRLRDVATFAEKKKVLNRFKDDEVFLIDIQHLLDPHRTLLHFSQALTDLTEVILNEALRVCAEEVNAAEHGAFTICGLGKFGGREMGYASDMELLFVHEERVPGDNWFFEQLARQFVEFIETRSHAIFQIDLRLRPYGDAGAWSVPFAEFQRYYSASGAAVAFERQALIKLRWVGGDEELGRRVEAHRDSFTFGGAPWDAQNALHLRSRQMRELVRPSQINVKYSAGGIIDIEYFTQYLQLVHGHENPALRVPTTLDALDGLRRLEIITESEHLVLLPAYLFLRDLIDALRIVRGDASDLVLPESTSEEFKSLARRLGYREHDRTLAARRLAEDVAGRMKDVHQVFIDRFNPKKT